MASPGPLRALDLAIGGTPAPNLLQYLPHTALAAVVIAAAIGLFEVVDLRHIYRVQWWEFWLSMVCFAGVAVFGAIAGIALAVVMAVIEFLWDGWRPQFNDRHASGIEPCFAEMKDPVKDKLKRFGLFTRLGEHTFFATLGEAVAAYRAAHSVERVDWEESTSPRQR